MTEPPTRWALILGASSGFGEACALEFAAAGYDIFGVHLDRKQGLVHVEEIVSAIERQGQRAHFFNINAADHEKRREALAEMERLAAVGQTISMVMHELKNIVQIAKLADELVRRGIKNQNEKFLQHGLDGIAKALKEMDGFIWDMLSLTKDYRVEPQKTDLGAIVEELKHDFEEKTRELGITLDFQVEEGFSPVDADSRALYRALLNLVQNAMEACEKDESFIRIRVQSKDKDFYEIKIEDNGKGMTPEVRAKIFQAFFSTKGRRGNGLGLMIVERTCKAHQGNIQVHSEQGKGTSMTLTFPKTLPRS